MSRVPRSACIVALLFTCASSVFGQDSQEQKLWAVYWNVEPGFTSALEMKNNHVSQTLTVGIELYFSNGEEYALPGVELAPRQTTVVDLNSAIANLPPAIAARAGKEGTLEVEFTSPTSSNLMGSVSVTNPEKGIAWNFFLYPRRTDPEATSAPVRGVFWFRDNSTDGFVTLQNVSDENAYVTSSFQVNGVSHALPEIALLAGQGLKLDLRKELRNLGLDDVTAGGIQFTYRGAPDALKGHGVLFDGHGFSAEMDLTRQEYYEQPHTAYLRTPRFAIGPADAKLGLPSATVFSPFVTLHNFGQSALNVSLAVRFPSGGSTQTVNIPVAVAANNTVVVPLVSHLNGVVPADVSWASLEVGYSDNQNSLAAALVSVSEDGAHSIRSVLNWVEGSAREGWFWRVDASHNTFISMLNTDTEEARVAISLDYQLAGESRSYRLPERTLAAKASSVVDVGEIIATGEPDAEGNVIPASVGFGGYQVRKVDVRADQTVTTEALVFDRRSKNFLTLYNTCCGITPGSVTFSLSSFNGTLGFIGTASAEGDDYCGGGPVELPGTFSSSNPAISSVNSGGNVSGVSPGSTFTNTSVAYSKQKTIDGCTPATQSNSAPTSVKPTITSISPSRGLVGTSVAVKINGTGFANLSSVNAGTSITATITSHTDTQISANFQISATAPGGNQAVTVTAGGQPSNSVNFFVQIPTKVIRVDHPGAPGGVGPLVIITDGNVVDLDGNIQATHECGVYRNYAYELVDQQAQAIDQSYVITEWFSNYSGVSTLPAPRTVTIPANSLLGDTMFFGTSAPACPGPNDNETFTQNSYVTIAGQQFPLTTKVRVSRGRFSGEYRVDETILVP